MDNNRGRYSVELMAQSLNVSPSAYYNYKRGLYQTREEKKEDLKQSIVDVYFLSQGTYGAPRIAAELTATNFSVSRNTVAHYMREIGQQSKLSVKFKVVTTDSNHDYYIAPNLLKRNFIVDEACKIWVTDITYIHTEDGFIYLTTVIDLFDRKVIGWSISNNMTAKDTTVAALEMAIKSRRPKSGTMIHSDRGSQYAGDEFSSLVKRSKMVQSMSRKGNCWDNAVAESFFKTLKCELIYDTNELSAEEMKLEVFRYIETWYNRKRRHSALGNLTNEEFWNKIKMRDTNKYKEVA